MYFGLINSLVQLLVGIKSYSLSNQEDIIYWMGIYDSTNIKG